MNGTGHAPTAPLFTPGRCLPLAVLAGYCVLVLFPEIRWRLGLFDHGMWFLDSYAVLASSEAVLAGHDPFGPNPLDLMQRPHSYSSWWFGLGRLGLDREDNFLVGGVWVTGFAAAVLVCLRPVAWRQVLVGVAVLLSPPVVLAVNRANNDLVVFALLAAGGITLRTATGWRIAWFIGVVALATGLKFYPVVAASVLLLIRPAVRAWISVIAGGLVAGFTLASVWADFGRAVFPVPVRLHTFGAGILLQELGWPGVVPLGGALLVMGAVAVLVHRRGWSVPLAGDVGTLPERVFFAVGAVLLVGCFFAGVSYAYRLIFMIFLLPLLWRYPGGRAGALTTGLVLTVLWLDGLYCLVANTVVGPMPQEELVHRQGLWRLVSQPVVWAAMTMLAGSLVGLPGAMFHERMKGRANA